MAGTRRKNRNRRERYTRGGIGEGAGREGGIGGGIGRQEDKRTKRRTKRKRNRSRRNTSFKKRTKNTWRKN